MYICVYIIFVGGILWLQREDRGFHEAVSITHDCLECGLIQSCSSQGNGTQTLLLYSGTTVNCPVYGSVLINVLYMYVQYVHTYIHSWTYIICQC